MAYTIDSNALVKDSWEHFKKNWKPFVGILAVLWSLSVLNMVVVGPTTGFLRFVVSVVFLVPMMIIGAGSIRWTVASVEGAPLPFSAVFNGFDVLIPFLLATILYNVATVVGVFAFIVPGVIIAIRWGFYAYAVAIDNLGPVDALKSSHALTQGRFWDLSLLATMVLALNILGALLLGVGLFVTVPMTMIIAAKVYKGLKTA